MRNTRFFIALAAFACLCPMAWSGTVVEDFGDGTLDCPWTFGKMWNPSSALDTDFTVANGVGTFQQAGAGTTGNIGLMADGWVGNYLYGDFTLEWTFPDVQQFQDGMGSNLFYPMFWPEGGGIDTSIVYIYRGGDTLHYCAMGVAPDCVIDIAGVTKLQMRLVKNDDGTDSWMHFWYNVDNSGWVEYVEALYPHKWPNASGRGIYPYIRVYHEKSFSIDIDDLTLTNDALPFSYCAWEEPPTDTTPPVISLNGPDTISVSLGGAFVDPVTASDDVDGNLTGSLVITGDSYPPNTGVEATYTYHYNVQDAAGNPATEVTLTVVVLADTDEDGLSDSWEIAHFGDLTQGPDDDPDGDGRTNAQEFVDGTDPMSAASKMPVAGLVGVTALVSLLAASLVVKSRR